MIRWILAGDVLSAGVTSKGFGSVRVEFPGVRYMLLLEYF